MPLTVIGWSIFVLRTDVSVICVFVKVKPGHSIR